jgi:hypothetical protein
VGPGPETPVDESEESSLERWGRALSGVAELPLAAGWLSNPVGSAAFPPSVELQSPEECMPQCPDACAAARHVKTLKKERRQRERKILCFIGLVPRNNSNRSADNSDQASSGIRRPRIPFPLDIGEY